VNVVAMPATRASLQVGLSLLETAIAVAIVAAALAALAPALVTVTGTIARAGGETRALAMAQSRLEQFAALTYDMDEETATLSADEATDFSSEPPTSTGTGLQPGDITTIWEPRPGYSELLAADGAAAPSRDEAMFIRRWSVSVLDAGGMPELLLLQAFARMRALEAREPLRDDEARRPGDVWFFTLRAPLLR
jgi:type II secretory pathway pseudopilin PulG